MTLALLVATLFWGVPLLLVSLIWLAAGLFPAARAWVRAQLFGPEFAAAYPRPRRRRAQAVARARRMRRREAQRRRA